MRVVLIDDQKEFHTLFRRVLSMLYPDMDFTAFSGTSNLCLCDLGPPQDTIVFLDYQMPEEDGASFFARIHAKAHGNWDCLPFMVAFSSEGLTPFADRVGYDIISSYMLNLPKTFDMQELQLLIDTILERKNSSKICVDLAPTPPPRSLVMAQLPPLGS